MNSPTRRKNQPEGSERVLNNERQTKLSKVVYRKSTKTPKDIRKVARNSKKSCRKVEAKATGDDISSNARQRLDGIQDTATVLLFKENELCIM